MHRLRVRIKGIVQGVGFRPFLFRLAREFHLTGRVLNDGEGVLLEIQGPETAAFLAELPQRIPIVARIDSLVSEPIPVRVDETDFRIIESGPAPDGTHASALVTPDLMLCDDCRRELYDPGNRRYLYPFLNCTACGPRFTIVRTIPYERKNTAMDLFPLCEDCAKEYGDPADRRFHAEPVACHRCGPRLHLLSVPPASHAALTEIFREGHQDSAQTLQQRTLGILVSAAKILEQGKILAVKALGGWHLAVDATNEPAVLRLRERKSRDEKPFAVMFTDLAQLDRYARASEDEKRLLSSAAAPIVLLDWRSSSQSSTSAGDSSIDPIAPAVAPDGMYLGAMLPSTPLHDLLLHFVQRPLVMTSGNRSGNPTVFTDARALDELSGVADAFLFHDREIITRCDDSVVRLEPVVEAASPTRAYAVSTISPAVPSIVTPTGETHRRPTVFYRRSRGYAPDSIESPFAFRQTVFAAGAYLNNTFAFGTGRRVLPGHHIGDLDHPSTIEAFREGIRHYERLFSLDAECFVADLHPDYPSTNLAAEEAGKRNAPFVQVQHHEAHIAACLAENGHMGPALGLALDGTGYGRDGTLWGGELFRVNARFAGPMERISGLLSLPMPGGEAAVHEPWRMALSLLSRAFPGAPSDELSREINRIDIFAKIPSAAKEAVLRRLDQGILTSGCGRLFDAVSFLAGGPPRASYEGHPAIALEGMLSHESYSSNAGTRDSRRIPDPLLMADRPLTSEEAYPWTLRKMDGRWILDPGPLALGLIADLRKGQPPYRMALKFHRGLASALFDLIQQARADTEIDTIALSGGCLFNCYLSLNLDTGLRRRRFHVLRHRQLPAGDGGIAFGQLFLSGELEPGPKRKSTEGFAQLL